MCSFCLGQGSLSQPTGQFRVVGLPLERELSEWLRAPQLLVLLQPAIKLSKALGKTHTSLLSAIADWNQP